MDVPCRDASFPTRRIHKDKSQATNNIEQEDEQRVVKTDFEDVKQIRSDLRVDNAPSVKRRPIQEKNYEENDESFPRRPVPSLPNSGPSNRDAASCNRKRRGLFIGAYISSAGGVKNAPLNALRIGGNAFSCFVRPKMQWASKPITQASAEQFKRRVAMHSYMPPPHTAQQGSQRKTKADQGTQAEPVTGNGYIVPHGCYLVNFANPDPAKREKSFEAFMDDLHKCELLGIRLFNFHPDSMTNAQTIPEHVEGDSNSRDRSSVKAKEEACSLVASYINRAHALTSFVTILVENMAGSKNDTILGSSLQDLAAILSGVHDKSRVGVCIDTCHAFAAGYDIRTPSTYHIFTSELDRVVGWENVKAMHLNDSKFPLGSRKDRHANIGKGFIGLGGFWNVVNDDRWQGIPLILETPALGNASAAFTASEATKRMHTFWNYQINSLYALRGTPFALEDASQAWEESHRWLEMVDAICDEADQLHLVRQAEKKGHSSQKAKGKGLKRTESKGRKKLNSRSEITSEDDSDTEDDLSHDGGDGKRNRIDGSEFINEDAEDISIPISKKCRTSTSKLTLVQSQARNRKPASTELKRSRDTIPLLRANQHQKPLAADNLLVANQAS